MKFVIQNQTHYLAHVHPGTYVKRQDAYGAFIEYTPDISAAQIYDSSAAATTAVSHRNQRYGGVHPATFALVPVEVTPPPPPPTPTVRRLI